jgi:tetratricopeptide (TPR) repeat protein
VLGNGELPAGYHWFNLLLHSLNIGLVYALGLAIFDEISFAWLLAALWGVHPALTESVTNVVGRSDMLAACAVLAALLFHRRALDEAGARRAAWLGALAAVVAIGMFSKESAIVVLAVLFLHDICFEPARAWRARLAGYLAAAAPCAVFLAARTWVLAQYPRVPVGIGENTLVSADFLTARATAIRVLGEYLRVLAWPARLSWDYSLNQIPLFAWGANPAGDAATLLSALACAAALAAALVCWRRHRIVSFAVGLFFIAIAPVSNLVILIGTIMGERFLYLPAFGFLLAVVYGLRELRRRLPRRRRAIQTAVGLVLLACLARTWARNGDWGDATRFWQSGLESAPNSHRTLMNAVYERPLASGADVDLSLANTLQATALVEHLPDEQSSFAVFLTASRFYRNVGERLAAGKDCGRAAAASTPADWYGRALAAVLRSERIALIADARLSRETARRGIAPHTSLPATLYLEKGRAYRRLNQPERALEAFERGRQLQSDADLLDDLSDVYATLNRPHDAALALVEALSVEPGRRKVAARLIGLYRKLDPDGCSVTGEGKAAQLNVSCPFVHADICAASANVAASYLRHDQRAEAAEIERIAATELGCAAAR